MADLPLLPPARAALREHPPRPPAALPGLGLLHHPAAKMTALPQSRALMGLRHLLSRPWFNHKIPGISAVT